jgi:hypothetical protein
VFAIYGREAYAEGFGQSIVRSAVDSHAFDHMASKERVEDEEYDWKRAYSSYCLLTQLDALTVEQREDVPHLKTSTPNELMMLSSHPSMAKYSIGAHGHRDMPGCQCELAALWQRVTLSRCMGKAAQMPLNHPGAFHIRRALRFTLSVVV